MAQDSARSKRRTRKESLPLYDDINITPMLDLAYVLLVMFIILTTAAVQGVHVRLPATHSADNLRRPQTRAITVTADGSVYLDAYPVTLEELRRSLARYKAANPRLPVVVKGDADTQYRRILEVMDVAKSLDITQLGLVTRHSRQGRGERS
jgi:biopolymer transport protein ExbD